MSVDLQQQGPHPYINQSGSHPRPAAEPGPHRRVKAKDIFKESFTWRGLMSDVKAMLTHARVDVLERDYNLIDPASTGKIKTVLPSDPVSAATTLLRYFEDNHDGDDLLRFCDFLRDESEEAGGSAALEGLAGRIERAVGMLTIPLKPILITFLDEVLVW